MCTARFREGRLYATGSSWYSVIPSFATITHVVSWSCSAVATGVRMLCRSQTLKEGARGFVEGVAQSLPTPARIEFLAGSTHIPTVLKAAAKSKATCIVVPLVVYVAGPPLVYGTMNYFLPQVTTWITPIVSNSLTQGLSWLGTYTLLIGLTGKQIFDDVFYSFALHGAYKKDLTHYFCMQIGKNAKKTFANIIPKEQTEKLEKELAQALWIFFDKKSFVGYSFTTEQIPELAKKIKPCFAKLFNEKFADGIAQTFAELIIGELNNHFSPAKMRINVDSILFDALSTAFSGQVSMGLMNRIPWVVTQAITDTERFHLGDKFKGCECDLRTNVESEVRDGLHFYGKLGAAFVISKCIPVIGPYAALGMNALTYGSNVVSYKYSTSGMCAQHRHALAENAYCSGFGVIVVASSAIVSRIIKMSTGVESFFIDLAIGAFFSHQHVVISFMQEAPRRRALFDVSFPITYTINLIVDDQIKQMMARLNNPQTRESFLMKLERLSNKPFVRNIRAFLAGRVVRTEELLVRIPAFNFFLEMHARGFTVKMTTAKKLHSVLNNQLISPLIALTVLLSPKGWRSLIEVSKQKTVEDMLSILERLLILLERGRQPSEALASVVKEELDQVSAELVDKNKLAVDLSEPTTLPMDTGPATPSVHESFYLRAHHTVPGMVVAEGPHDIVEFHAAHLAGVAQALKVEGGATPNAIVNEGYCNRREPSPRRSEEDKPVTLVPLGAEPMRVAEQDLLAVMDNELLCLFPPTASPLIVAEVPSDEAEEMEEENNDDEYVKVTPRAGRVG